MKGNAIYQIKVNNVLMLIIYYSLREAINACSVEKARGLLFLSRLYQLINKKGDCIMQKQFGQYLLEKNYKPTTSVDYPARLERFCRKEKSLWNILHNI